MIQAHKILGKFLSINEQETHAVIWSFFYFFFLLSSYYILQPIRDEMGLLIGKEYLPSLFRWSLLVMIVISPIFSILVTKLPRKKFIPLVYHFFLANLLLFFLGFKFYSELFQVELAKSYFLWVSVFNLFAVSIFWGFMSDIFSSNQGKRLFGFIGAGGTLGQIFGSSFTTIIVHIIGNTNLLLVSAIFLELSVFCMLKVGKNLKDKETNKKIKLKSEEESSSIWDGISSVLKSKYLLSICGFMFLYTFTSTFLYFEKQSIVSDQILCPYGSLA